MTLKFIKVTTDGSGVVEKVEAMEGGQAASHSPLPHRADAPTSQDGVLRKPAFTPISTGEVRGVPKNVRPRVGFDSDEDEQEPAKVSKPSSPAPSPSQPKPQQGKRKPGRPKKNPEPEIPVINRAVMLAGQLEFGHAMVASIIPGFEITPTQAKAYGEALDNFMTVYKIEVSEKTAALMGLITVAGAIELPKLKLAKTWLEAHGARFGKPRIPQPMQPEVMGREPVQAPQAPRVQPVNQQGIAVSEETASGLWAHQSNEIARSDD